MPLKKAILLSLASVSLLSLGFAQVKGKRPDLSGDDFRERMKEGYLPVNQPEPNVTQLEAEILDKAYTLLETNPEYAYSFLQETLDTDAPVSAAFNHALGNVYFRNGNNFLAETQFQSAVKKYPTFRRAWNALGIAQYRQSNYGDAADSLARSVKLGANDATTYGLLGYCHLQLGRHRSAETAYDFAILFDPEETDWAEGIAQVYYETNRYEEAISVFDNLIRANPEDNEFWLLKANAYLAMDKPVSTARCIEIARRIGQVDTETMYLLGNLYLKQGIYQQAQGVFLAASSEGGEINPVELLKAVRYLIYNEQGAFAEDILAMLPEEDPQWDRSDKTLYRFLKADLADSRGAYEEAERLYASGLELDPLNGYSLLKLADLKVRQGKTEESIIYFDRAAVDPDSKYSALVSKAMVLIDAKQFRYALKTIEQALEERKTPRLDKLYAQVKRVIETDSERSFRD